jgi:hypothetical protein
MPLSKTGKKIRAAMRDEYGFEKGTRIFYATENKLKSLNVKRRKRNAKKNRKPS